MNNILYFGGGGYLGRPLCKKLQGDATNFVIVGRTQATNLTSGSVISFGNVNDIILEVNPDLIIYGVKRQLEYKTKQAMDFFRALCGAISALNKEVKVVNLGSAAEYGFLPEGKNCSSETDVKLPVGEYGKEKLLISNFLQENSKKFRLLDLKIFNLFCKTPQVGHFPHSILSQYMTDTQKVVIKDGESVRDYIDLLTAVGIIRDLILSDAVGIVNVCSGIGRSNIEFTKYYLRWLGINQTAVVAEPDRNYFYSRPTRSIGCTERLNKLLETSKS